MSAPGEMRSAPEFIVFRRDEWVRYWQQPSVGGTEHGYHAPQEVGLEQVGWRWWEPRPVAGWHFTDEAVPPVGRDAEPVYALGASGRSASGDAGASSATSGEVGQ